MEIQQQPVIGGQTGNKKPPDSSRLDRLAKWCGGLVHAVLSREGRQQQKLAREKDRFWLEIEQMNIEELCLLSPEDFLSSQQFFKLVRFYNLLSDPESTISKERLQDSSASEFIVGGVFAVFIKLRTDLSQDPQREKKLSEFTARLLKYLHDKDRPNEVREDREDRLNRLVGIPDIIRRFNVLGISLSHNDAGGYSDWCIFSRPTATGSIIAFSYSRELSEITHRQMSLIESGFRFNSLSKGEFIEALVTGILSFDDLMKRIADKLPRT